MFRHKSIDMIHGPLLPKILIFALPLMASNLLQLLFNAADIIVVGRFSGPESQLSLAAVGSTTSIVALFVYLLVGLSVGVNVIAAHCYGAGNQEEIGKIVHTSVFVALSGGLLFTAAGLLASRAMLAAVSTPEEVFSLALLYIRIYFFGIPFTLLYNYGAALLRARGDTERPLLYLTASGLLNVVLNLFFVVVLHMNVAGVALATVLSQGLSAGLILRFLIVSQDELHLDFRKLRPDRQIFLRLMQLGLPAGLQSSLFSIANIVIQAAINSYGSTVMAAVSAAFSIESFLYVAMNSFHHAAQTFTGQNLAAGEQKRADRVLWLCLGCTVAVGSVSSALVVLFAEPLIGIYNTNPAVIAAGVERLKIVASTYVIYGMADILTGAIRGYAVSVAPMLINLFCTCICRVVWIGLLDTSTKPVTWVHASFPISWAFLLIALAGYMVYLRHRKKPPVHPTGGF
ncbi:MAG: MATE family efflux transporter [Clostridium sp.]|nr:MATE family efflux transporter [Clostridium sp.]